MHKRPAVQPCISDAPAPKNPPAAPGEDNQTDRCGASIRVGEQDTSLETDPTQVLSFRTGSVPFSDLNVQRTLPFVGKEGIYHA